MTGTGGVKDVQYKEIDLLILDVLGKDNPSVEGLCGDDCFQADETVADKQQAECIGSWYTLTIFCQR